MEFLWIRPFSNCICVRWRMYPQLDIWSIGRIMSRPKTNRPRLLCLVQWYVICSEIYATTRMPIHGSASFTYIFCRLYVRTLLPRTWYILSIVAFACGFPGEADYVLIIYSCSIKLLLNSWMRNCPPWSYMIYTGHGYWTSHVVSTKFAIVIDFL